MSFHVDNYFRKGKVKKMLTAKINGSRLFIVASSKLSQNSVNQNKVIFSFSSDWDNLTKLAIFKNGEVNKAVIIDNDTAYIPWEVLSDSGVLEIGVQGTDADTVRFTTTISTINIENSLVYNPLNPQSTLTWWEQYYEDIQLQVANTVKQADNALASYNSTKEISEKFNQNVIDEKIVINEKVNIATEQANNAKISADKAKTAETNALDSKQVASQALSDLLALLGSDVATLTGGKLTPSQIPDLSINNSFLITAESELTSLTAQTGDMAYQENEDGDVTALWWLVGDDSTVLANWKQLGLSFVPNSGHANTADTATNANKINNKRIVNMTEEQYLNAVKEDNTYYFVSEEVV